MQWFYQIDWSIDKNSRGFLTRWELKMLCLQVKSNLGGPRPFGVPTAGPRSPALNNQSWSQPKPAPTFANYGSHTLPRSTIGQSAPG